VVGHPNHYVRSLSQGGQSKSLVPFWLAPVVKYLVDRVLAGALSICLRYLELGFLCADPVVERRLPQPADHTVKIQLRSIKRGWGIPREAAAISQEVARIGQKYSAFNTPRCSLLRAVPPPSRSTRTRRRIRSDVVGWRAQMRIFAGLWGDVTRPCTDTSLVSGACPLEPLRRDYVPRVLKVDQPLGVLELLSQARH